ncbi:MAG: glycogen/starch synthase [Steroidobacteraceae bacterium]
MRICHISAEYSPFAKAGGLGDVVAALTRHLCRRGHDLRVFVPLHGQMELGGVDRHPVEGLRGLPVRVGAHEFACDIHTARAPDSDLWIHLVDCPPLFDRPRIYSDAPDEHLRYLALTRAAFDCCQRMGYAPDIVHAHDWHTAFAPLLLRTAYAWDRDCFGAARSVFTIHNIGYQGVFGASRAADVGPGVDLAALDAADLALGRVNPMRQAILHADAVTTVSPTYAWEICTPEGGHGLDGDLRARGDAVVGILNGIDCAEWNPASDRYLPHRYDADDLTGKLRNREALLDLLRMPAPPTTPVIGMVTRLVAQKGIDLLVEVLPELLATRELRFVALGSGEARYEAFMQSLHERFPGRAAFYSGYSEELAHMIEAAADMFLMPSAYEPCGLNQLYSLRYGTVPVVRRTGGLADSVRHYDPRSGSGNGIVFEHYDANGLRWALDTALEWHAHPRTWRRIVQNGMREDNSWERRVAEYERLYGRCALGMPPRG